MKFEEVMQKSGGASGGPKVIDRTSKKTEAIASLFQDKSIVALKSASPYGLPSADNSMAFPDNKDEDTADETPQPKPPGKFKTLILWQNCLLGAFTYKLHKSIMWTIFMLTNVVLIAGIGVFCVFQWISPGTGDFNEDFDNVTWDDWVSISLISLAIIPVVENYMALATYQSKGCGLTAATFALLIVGVCGALTIYSCFWLGVTMHYKWVATYLVALGAEVVVMCPVKNLMRAMLRKCLTGSCSL
jgi:hypothetical protein